MMMMNKKINQNQNPPFLVVINQLVWWGRKKFLLYLMIQMKRMTKKNKINKFLLQKRLYRIKKKQMQFSRKMKKMMINLKKNNKKTLFYLSFSLSNNNLYRINKINNFFKNLNNKSKILCSNLLNLLK